MMHLNNEGKTAPCTKRQRVDFFECCICHVLSLDFLTIKDLGSLCVTCSTLNDAVHQDHVWRPFLNKNRVGFDPNITRNEDGDFDDSEWVNKFTPPQDFSPSALRVPARQSGVMFESKTFLPHAEDKIAINHNLAPLLLAAEEGHIFTNNIRINHVTGAIEDLFYPKNDRETFIYLERAMPIKCAFCNIVCNTHNDFLIHLKSRLHCNNGHQMARKHCWNEKDLVSKYTGEIKSPWYEDPREVSEYYELSAFHKVRTLFHYKHKMLEKIYVTLSTDLYTKKKVRMLLKKIRLRAAADGHNVKLVTFDRVIKKAEEILINDFVAFGARGAFLFYSFCRDGWKYAFSEEADFDGLYLAITSGNE